MSMCKEAASNWNSSDMIEMNDVDTHTDDDIMKVIESVIGVNGGCDVMGKKDMRTADTGVHTGDAIMKSIKSVIESFLAATCIILLQAVPAV